MALFSVIFLGGCSDDAKSPARDAAPAGPVSDAAADTPVVSSPDGGPEVAVNAEVGPSCQTGCDLGGDSPAGGDVAFDVSADLSPVGDVTLLDGAALDTGVAADGATIADPEVCSRVCALAAMVPCPGAMPCLASCLASLQGKCAAANSALVACSAARPASDFECREDGVIQVVLRDDLVCEAERVALLACIRQP